MRRKLACPFPFRRLGTRAVAAEEADLRKLQHLWANEESVQPSMLVVGDPIFLARHRPLIDALRKRLRDVEELPVNERAVIQKVLYLARAAVTGRLWPPERATARKVMQRFRKEPATFDRISRLATRRISRTPSDTFILQLFSMSSPASGPRGRPYAHYIDMTMAMVRRNWTAWAPFERDGAYEQWIAREGASYRGARRVFTFSEATRRSVIDDYGASPERVVTVGAAGHYHEASTRERSYGNRTLIFNGSDFMRKGGDRVLAAFRLVRNQFPDTSLTVVASEGMEAEAGLRSLGKVSRPHLFELFDSTDVVIAPTRMDVFPGFVLEAMSRGVVPILSDAESMDEIITDGVNGYVVSPTTPALLAQRIVRLFQAPSLLRSFGDESRARVISDWNWDAVAGRMVAALERELPG